MKGIEVIKKNIGLTVIVLVSSGLMAWSLLELFKASEVQQAALAEDAYEQDLEFLNSESPDEEADATALQPEALAAPETGKKAAQP